MKNFVFGLLAGLVIASSFVFLDSNPTEPPAEVVTYLLDNKSKEESNIQANDEGKFSQNALREPTRQVKSNQESAADNRRNNENTEGSQERARIEKILEGLNDEGLKRVESMISRLNERSPSEKFEVEDIDAEWSLTKQAELEYSFYESSSLRDFGNLDSVICKSQSCQVKVSIPSDLHLRPSHFMDWSNPVATTLMPHQEDPDSKILVIYIKR